MREAERERLPKERAGRTHKFKVGQYEGYITTGEYEDGRLGEMFLTDMGKEGSFVSGIMGTWAKTFSVALQHGVALDSLLTKYRFVRFEEGMVDGDPAIHHATSVVDYIAQWLALKYGSDELKQEWRLDEGGMCGRIMVGSGDDTYDPTCELPRGHDGNCKSSAALDQHKLEK